MRNLYYAPPGNFRKSTVRNTGGYTTLYYIPVNDVLIVPGINTATNTITGAFTLAAGKKWYQATLIDPKRNYKEEQKTGDGGNFVDISVTGMFAFETAAVHLAKDSLKNYRYLLLVATSAGLMRLVGSLDNPAQVAFLYDSGTGSKDVPGTMATFLQETQDFPPLYAGPAVPVYA